MFISTLPMILPIALLQTVVSATWITWNGFPYAKTSQGNQNQALLSISGTSDAQILYTKNTKDSSMASLVTVYLINDDLPGVKWPLMTSFDVISQTCSCYYIDAKDFSKLPDGSSIANGFAYRLWFLGGSGATAVNEQSGTFGVNVGQFPQTSFGLKYTNTNASTADTTGSAGASSSATGANNSSKSNNTSTSNNATNHYATSGSASKFTKIIFDWMFLVITALVTILYVI